MTLRLICAMQLNSAGGRIARFKIQFTTDILRLVLGLLAPTDFDARNARA
jgi:hypothetical protein